MSEIQKNKRKKNMTTFDAAAFGLFPLWYSLGLIVVCYYSRRP